MYGLPPVKGFVSADDSISVNGELTNQHPINEQEYTCYPGVSYTHFCSVEDWEAFDHIRFIKERKNYKSILKTKKVFVYKMDDYRLAALMPA